MASIVLGLATSHSPQLSLPAEHWLRRGEEDRTTHACIVCLMANM